VSEIPGVRLRVFGWPETWRVVPARRDPGWSFRIVLLPETPGRALPPFLTRADWTHADLAEGLRAVKDDIRRQAETARRRAFLVDEEPEDLED